MAFRIFPTKMSFRLLLLYLVAQVAAYVDREMTISVEAGDRECFYESAKAGQTIDIEYQVIDGGHGDLDISFELGEAGGRQFIYKDFKKSENIHRLTLERDMDFRFCFDNSFSTFNRKTVFFELIVESEGEQQSDETEFEGLSADEVYDLTVTEISDYVLKIRAYMTRARQLQDVLKSYEARDRNLAEEKFFKVNAWSFIQILIMFLVGGLQVFMIRSLFDSSDSRAHKLWAKLRR